MTSCARGLPGHRIPGRTCQIAPKEIPVEAMDSMMTQGMVNKAPTAVTTIMDHQGVSVGHAVTPAMDTTKPKAKTIPYYMR